MVECTQMIIDKETGAMTPYYECEIIIQNEDGSSGIQFNNRLEICECILDFKNLENHYTSEEEESVFDFLSLNPTLNVFDFGDGSIDEDFNLSEYSKIAEFLDAIDELLLESMSVE